MPINVDSKNENNNSIVLFGKIDGVKYLFWGIVKRGRKWI